jgi:hypothetical protein
MDQGGSASTAILNLQRDHEDDEQTVQKTIPAKR